MCNALTAEPVTHWFQKSDMTHQPSHNSIKKHKLLGIIIIVITAVMLSVLYIFKPQPEVIDNDDNSLLVEVSSIQPQNVQYSVHSQGNVLPRTESTLIVEVSGNVNYVSPHFYVGGLFKKDELLIELDASEYKVNVKQAEAQLASQKARYAQEKARALQAQKEWDLSGRKRKDAPKLALREPYLDEAKANVLSAEAHLLNAQRLLDKTKIRAPYDGMVRIKSVDIGQFITLSTPVATIFATDFVEVRLPINDDDLGFIQQNTIQQTSTPDTNSQTFPPVLLTANYAGKPHQWLGHLKHIEGIKDQANRIHYGIVRVKDPYQLANETNTINNASSHTRKPPLKVGTFVKASIQGTKESHIIVLPRERFINLNQVLVSDQQQQLAFRTLDIVRIESEKVYVRSGFLPGDQLIVTSIENPVQGTPIKLKTSDKLKPSDKFKPSDNME